MRGVLVTATSVRPWGRRSPGPSRLFCYDSEVDEARATRFAIAVRDQDGLWLFLWLKSDRRGDVYLFWPIKEEGRNSHATYHRDGRTHHKSFNKPFMVRRRQKPDTAFSGPEQIVTTPIYCRCSTSDTGLSPEIAQTLVNIGVDLGKMNTVGDLQGGIEEAERLLGYKAVLTREDAPQ